MTKTKTIAQHTIWSKDFILHTISYLFVFSGFYFLLPTLPFFVVDELHQDKSQVGLIIGVYAVSALLIRPFAGYALDRYGRKYVYLLSMVCYVVIAGLYMITTSFAGLLLVRVLHGLSWGVITNGGITIASDMVPENRRGEGIGYFSLAITLSMAIGPLVGLMVLEETNFDTLFIAGFIISAVALVLALLIHYPPISNPRQQLSWTLIFESRVFHITLVMLITAITYGGLMSFITLYAKELNVENLAFVFLVYASGVASLRPFSGRFMDKKGPAGIVLVSYLITITGYLMLSQTNSEWLFLLACFVTGIGNGLIMPTILTMTANLVHPSRRGVANGTIYSSTDLGIFLGSVVLGLIAEWVGLANMFLIAGLLMALPLIYFFAFALKHYNHFNLNKTSS